MVNRLKFLSINFLRAVKGGRKGVCRDDKKEEKRINFLQNINDDLQSQLKLTMVQITETNQQKINERIIKTKLL